MRCISLFHNNTRKTVTKDTRILQNTKVNTTLSDSLRSGVKISGDKFNVIKCVMKFIYSLEPNFGAMKWMQNVRYGDWERKIVTEIKREREWQNKRARDRRMKQINAQCIWCVVRCVLSRKSNLRQLFKAIIVQIARSHSLTVVIAVDIDTTDTNALCTSVHKLCACKRMRLLMFVHRTYDFIWNKGIKLQFIRNNYFLFICFHCV